jgi:hypothetical protein
MQAKPSNRIIEVFGTSYDEHVKDIAMNLRKPDFDEVYAVTGANPYLAVLDDWFTSIRRWIILNKNNKAVAVLGVRPIAIFSNIGIPWLLGTSGLEKMKLFFVKNSKLIIEEMKKGYKILFNYVDARYLKAVRWLEWCGFTIEEAVPFGTLGYKFHRFYMECN